MTCIFFSDKDMKCDIYEKEGKWTATGKQFQVPYVFKTLFSHEKIEFEDMCETFSTTSAAVLMESVISELRDAVS